MPKDVAKVWTFVSDSNSSKVYETLQYTDLTTSCNCPGWTRRIDVNGNRTCKHTRLVDQDKADVLCTGSHDYTKTDRKIQVEFSAAKSGSFDPQGTGKRNLNL